tara:strand:+ start:271 stop:549 length:279 start_codon:yes stop_codon:yes gene_type:complete
LTPRSAQTYALTVLGWLVARDDLLELFVGSTGSTLESMKENAQEEGFLVSVLDFLMMDDQWVLDCCYDTNLDPNNMRLARLALPGGEEMHWT